MLIRSKYYINNIRKMEEHKNLRYKRSYSHINVDDKRKLLDDIFCVDNFMSKDLFHIL